MRVLLQRVSRGEVRIRTAAAAPRVAGRIGRGYVLLVGFTATDTDDHVAWMAEKVAGLRLFADADDKMNRALADVACALEQIAPGDEETWRLVLGARTLPDPALLLRRMLNDTDPHRTPALPRTKLKRPPLFRSFRFRAG